MTAINERVNVLVKFAYGKTTPVIFEWRGRRFTIQRISLIFDRNDGGRKFMCFAVDTGGMVAELTMDRTDFVWKITSCTQSYI
jgi:hypothetical protein